MKKICMVLVTICLFLTMVIPAKAEELSVELRVFLNSNGGIDANLKTNCAFKYPNETFVCIYRHDDILIASDRDPNPILCWSAYTRTETYPFSPNVYFGKNRESEFVNGEGSKLRPGKYFAVVIGWTPDLPNVELSERVDFEIPESTPAPTLPPVTPTPAAENKENADNPVFWVCTGAVSGAIITLAAAGIVAEVRKKNS